MRHVHTKSFEMVNDYYEGTYSIELLMRGPLLAGN